jgi:GntR family transcriptional regulator/MocR family aminotransferase
MEPLLGLSLTLPPPGSRARLRALHQQLRAAILDGRLRAGLRLPATRALAKMLGISRNTALAAYDLLLSEGYLAARPGSGTFVADVRRARREAPGHTGPDRRLAPFWRMRAAATQPIRAGVPYDLRLGLPDKGAFPFMVWRRLSARALRGLSKTPAAYAEPAGRPALREAIATHISFARAVACGAGDIVVTGGAQQAFDLLARILVTPGRSVVAVEEPGYPPLRNAFAAAGAVLCPVPVDGEGLVVERLPPTARVVCVTPSHHFPLGMALSPRRRAALLDFARTQRAAIIEDDYDGEFRYDGRPLDALQTLDRAGSVFYVGTFSKSLFPALRLGFVVAPDWARHALTAAKQLSDWHAPILAQETLSAFIAEGHLARHMRKMRRVYLERREALLRAIARHAPDALLPIPSAAGLHLAARLRGARGTDIAARAREAGVYVHPLEGFALAKPGQRGLALGYGMIEASRIDEAMRRIARCL